MTPPELRTFTASDGYEMAYRLWRPQGTPRALVIALHGIQSHAGWYTWSSARLAKAGYAVAFPDRRGSGANEVARGDAPHAERLIGDVVQFVRHLERTGFDRIPRVLSAISWGGKLAAAVAARHTDQFDGLALLTPGLCPIVRATISQNVALRLASSAGVGWKLVPIPLEDPSLFTDVAEYQNFIRDDPFTLRHVTVRFLRTSAAIDRFVAVHAASVHCPVLLMLAGRDRIIDNAATRRFVLSFGSTVKTLVDYPDACHTLEFEPGRGAIVADLVAWIDCLVARVARSQP